MSLFLFGGFQSHVSDLVLSGIRSDAIVLDVGANIGSMSLAFGRRFPEGTVYAFEPTDFAFGKLERNLELNPELARRIHPIKAFLARDGFQDVPEGIYSSWSLAGRANEAHPLHGGTKHSAAGAKVLTVDSFCEEARLEHVDFVKIDTDGYEFEVLLGARRTLKERRPVVVFETSLYGLQESGVEFRDVWDLLTPFGYRLVNLTNGRPVTLENHRRRDSTELHHGPACHSGGEVRRSFRPTPAALILHWVPLGALLIVLAGFACYTCIGFARGTVPSVTAIFLSQAWGDAAARTETFPPPCLAAVGDGRRGPGAHGQPLRHESVPGGSPFFPSSVSRSWFSRYGVLVCSGLFLFSLARPWANVGYMRQPAAVGDTFPRYSALLGFFPWLDAHAYYDGRQPSDRCRQTRFLERTPAAECGAAGRRLGLTRFDLRAATILQVLLLAACTFLASLLLARRLGVWVGIGMVALVLPVARLYQSTTLSEALGMTLGALSVGLLYEGIAGRNAYVAAAGLGAICLGMGARPGALLFVPAVLLALFLGKNLFRAGRRMALTAAGLAALLGLSWTPLLNREYGTGTGMASANFAYVTCGLAMGGSWVLPVRAVCQGAQVAAERAGEGAVSLPGERETRSSGSDADAPRAPQRRLGLCSQPRAVLPGVGGPVNGGTFGGSPGGHSRVLGGLVLRAAVPPGRARLLDSWLDRRASVGPVHLRGWGMAGVRDDVAILCCKRGGRTRDGKAPGNCRLVLTASPRCSACILLVSCVPGGDTSGRAEDRPGVLFQT